MVKINELIPEIKSDIEALEDLVIDNDMDKLEAVTSGFNIFESIGAVRREVRHSDFLAFLFNPKESHGLYDSFIKPVLFGVTKRNRSVAEISPIDIDLLDLSSMEVKREWENIDILLILEEEKFVFAIENKINSSEHSDQLNRYETIIEHNFEGYRKLFIYLTLDGDHPERDQNWIPYSYQNIYEVVTSMLSESSGKIGEDIFTLLRHYAEMINRHLMNDNEIAQLSKKIYEKHKKALDIIFEHKPDILTETNKYILEHLVGSNELDLELDHVSKSHIRFAVKHWDEIDGQLSGEGQWTKSNRVVLFEIINNLEGISLKLLIGPGEKKFRENVFLVTENEKKIFKGRSKLLYGKWTQIYKCKVVTKEQMEYDFESIKSLIHQELSKFFYYGEYEKILGFLDNKLSRNKSMIKGGSDK